MKRHRRKMIVPILISAVIVLYCILYFCFLITVTSGFIRILLGVIPLVLAAVMVAVCIERIKEIRGGEEDDLSQY